MTEELDVEFVAPGPGHWALDRSHYPGGTTPISEWLISESMPAGFGRVFAELGLPAGRVEMRFVNGFSYTRLCPLVGADKPPRRLPPAPVLRVMTRIHPAFRARTKQATATLRDRPSNEIARRWEEEMRPRLRATNLEFGSVDPGELSDDQLQEHVSALLDHLRQSFELHFWLHGHDLGPIARYLAESIEWGLDPTDAIRALAGASPSTARPTEILRALRLLVEAHDGPVTTLHDVREISDEAAALLDGYLAEYGDVLATGYDITSYRLVELPGLVLESIRTAPQPPRDDHLEQRAALRERVPAEARDDFDRLLDDARNVMEIRDSNGPQTVEWPAGLLRRALLVAGARLAARDAVIDTDHVFDLRPDEVRAMFDVSRPPATELAERAERRARLAASTPPATLGEPEPAPPLDVLPEVLAKLAAATQVAMKYLGMDESGDAPATRADAGASLSGVGIGSAVYSGRARVAQSADDAIEMLEPGDVLVVRATSPAFNFVLSIAGAVVTADGGALSHAAVLARELGIPAIVGAPGALSIADGTTVEVDPVAGSVRILDPV